VKPISTAEPFASSLEHILAELERLDLLLRLQVWRAREAVGGDELRGLTLSEEDVVAALERPLGQPHWKAVPVPPPWDSLPAQLAQRATHIEQRKRESLRQGLELRLETLARRCGLERFDVDALLLCLAPEVDLRYERAFAWLQDDVTRRRPTVDLVLGLLCPSLMARLAARGRFSPEAPLRRHELLHLHDAPGQPPPPLPGRLLELDRRIADYLHGSDTPDPKLAPSLRRVSPRPARGASPTFSGLVGGLTRLADEPFPPLVYLQGRDAADPRAAAEALCHSRGRPLLVMEGRGLLAGSDEQVEWAIRQAAREALLLDAVPCWEGVEALLTGERWGPRDTLLRALEEAPGLVLVSGASPWEPASTPRSRPFVWFEVPPPDPEEQVLLWAEALEEGASRVAPGVEPASLVRRYRLGREQLREAVATARGLARGRGAGGGAVTPTDVDEACRQHLRPRLGPLARRVATPWDWEDLVLPASRLEQLRELRDQARHRLHVLEDWGFAHKLGAGLGMGLLFAGPPGTGKTLAAGVLAADLGLELYRIDLSSVVSKYIGETEKHLARLFDEAERGHAVLLFDEADALFARRTEARDAHDRYANLETGYLLQRLEAFTGLAILTTNLLRNLDEAFVRRLRAIVEFPLPGARERRLLWERIWPEGTPLDPELDWDFMAHRFELTGGSIRDIALSAAFLAAAEGRSVRMPHLLHATRRECQKLGRVLDEAIFSWPP